MKVRKLCRKGVSSSENKDCCDFVELGRTSFFVVCDGGSSSSGSAKFSRALVDNILSQLVECYSGPMNFSMVKPFLNKILQKCQSGLSREYPGSYASLLIVVKNGRRLLSASLGDCVLGYMLVRGGIRWISAVQTLENALGYKTLDSIRKKKKRHILVRSFRAKRFVEPYYQVHIVPCNARLIICSDGFWGCLKEDFYDDFIFGNIKNNVLLNDDVSCLVVDS